MDLFRIRGNGPLKGVVQVSGAKNASLPIFAATLLTGEACTIHNVPDLSDMRAMIDILARLGAEVSNPSPGTWRVEAKEIDHRAPYELVRQMRASVCLLGPLVSRCRQAEVSIPGGCVIGPRPIDLHIKGLRKLGCRVEVRGGYIHVDASELRGGPVFLGGRHGSTVTGTANIIMAAVMAPGETRLEGAACEPEVVDLCEMLNKMGAQISGIGSPELVVQGVERLHGCEHTVIADRIEAGTYIVAAAVTRGAVRVEGIPPRLLGAFLDKCEEAGIPLECGSDWIEVLPYEGDLKPVDIITLPYPGFPTDLQAQMCALLAVTPGLSILTERIYPNRYMHVSELQRMGADMAIEGPSAIVKGGAPLSGAPVMASDLRASAALVIAALAAEGTTWVQRIYHLDRGYERFEQKLSALGADIVRLSDKDLPREFWEVTAD